MMPTLPFVYLIIIGASDTIVRQRFFFLRSKSFRYGTGTLVVCFCSIFAFSYTQTVYASKDSRIEAAEVAATKLSGNAAILSEVYDLGIIPFNEHFPSITLFNFYEVDSANPEATPEKLNELLQTTQYIILPSQRLYKTRILYPERYSVGGTFYTNLAEENGYRKIYETPCPLLCYLTYLGSPVFSYEATASVFDRPTVMIYEKL